MLVRMSRRAPIVLLVAALAAGSATAARSTFKGNVCGLLSAKQVTAISGLTAKCTNARPSKGPGSTIYLGNWAGKTPRSPRLQVTVSAYGDAGMLKLAQRNLNQGLPGTPKKLTGIGTGAYAAVGAGAAAIKFSAGSDVVLVLLNSIGATPKVSSLVPLAKAIAVKL
jgi:hypothetical protein